MHESIHLPLEEEAVMKPKVFNREYYEIQVFKWWSQNSNPAQFNNLDLQPLQCTADSEWKSKRGGGESVEKETGSKHSMLFPSDPW